MHLAQRNLHHTPSSPYSNYLPHSSSHNYSIHIRFHPYSQKYTFISPIKFIWRAYSISKQQSQSHSQHLTFWSNYKSTHETSHSSIHSSSSIHDYPNETSLVSQQDNLTITLTNDIPHSPNSFLPNDPLEEHTQSLNNNHQNSSIHETYVPCSFHNQ